MADEAPAAKSEPGDDVRALLHAEKSGVLATLSVKHDGFPFGSIAPFAPSRVFEPLMLMSTIAEHTRNALADPRASLLVQERAALDDPQAGARATILGRICKVPPEELADAGARYLARVPNAASYLKAHDFSFFKLSVESVRYIGGFGKIFWVDGAKVSRPLDQDPVREIAADVCTHMNKDHAEAMRLWCEAFRGRKVASASMSSVDAFGFDVQGDGQQFRFEFPRELTTSDQVRKAAVDLVKKARAQLGLAARPSHA